MQSLYDWIQLQRKTLSKHAEMAKAFDYILNHWNALNEFCRDGWVEIDNNIGENALRSVAVGRKNYLFFGSDKGGESAAIIYSLLVTCKQNEVEPEDWLREVIEKLNDWPSNQVHELLGFAPIFLDICYHLTHYKPAAADIPVASDNPAHYADAIRYNARTPLQGSLLPLTRLVWA